MRLSIPWVLALPARHFYWGSLIIVLIAAATIGTQIADRHGFANGELYRDVMERWGAPILQPAPSVRYVESGSVFNTLQPLALGSQGITLDATMNYRKRGLVYFSGFEFGFRGRYSVVNPEPHAIDIVFVFPVHAQKNRIMLSDRTFLVDGEPAGMELDELTDKLVWTGRLERGGSAELEIAFRGRGLDAFTYQLDPSLPARDFNLAINIEGGDNYDYGPGVVPAHSVQVDDGRAELRWSFAALESGVPVGVILPSEKSFDSIIVTMIRRAWATFTLFFASIVALTIYFNRRLRRYESYLIAAGYAFFFVLLPYLAAYMNFYLAYALTVGVMGTLLYVYVGTMLPPVARPYTAGLLLALLFTPTLAVVLPRITGLIYSLEILLGLAVVMALSTRPSFRTIIDHLERPTTGTEARNAV